LISDGVDPDDQTALPWLPQTLPAGVQVGWPLRWPARPARSAASGGFTTLNIEPLAAAEQKHLIQRYLQHYTKELDSGQRQQILKATSLDHHCFCGCC